jgi:predicted RNase H-like HicB family nuclease
MPATYYPAIVDRSESGFGISFPDFPGCIASGATVQDAAVNGEAALALHIDAMQGEGAALPPPSSLDDIEEVEGADDVARVLVRAATPAKFSRIQVTLEDTLLASIDAVAANRSGFLADAARAALRKESAPAERKPIGFVKRRKAKGLVQA